ncbi:MAG: hypothetical protein IJZ20_01555 [Clostridia bacterium]|nr:hypothetical protein [Clostridia bacterium]
MNPFEQKAKPVDAAFTSWSKIYPCSSNKMSTDPSTKTRIILMNGTEFESNWCSHQFARHCENNDLRRELAVTRRVEQQQQKILATLKPIGESLLETTISYEQLAVDLTAILAQREPDAHVKMALDFALLEDFDHLYRYADLLEQDKGIRAEQLVGRYTEIMPGRPTIAEHRYPYDNVKPHTDFKNAAPITKLNIGIITAAEQQTMNYYMNIAGFYDNDIGRQLYQEIGLIEEQHVSQYESLKDPNCTWLECMLMHEYTECYLYYSCYEDEKNPKVKEIWEQMFEEEVSHLHKAAELLQKYENKQWQQVIPDGNFPELLKFHDNIDYVRKVISETVGKTSLLDDYPNLDDIPDNAKFFDFQKAVNADVSEVPSHAVIDRYITAKGEDYRFQTAEHPIESLRDRKNDNVSIARVKQAVRV